VKPFAEHGSTLGGVLDTSGTRWRAVRKDLSRLFSDRPTTASVRVRWLVPLAVWALSLGYMASQLNRGWVAHDEGAFGQSAERVLNGELPHRDFDELYTGGLTYLHAAAFRAFGTNLATLRLVLFTCFLLWVPAVFYITSVLFPLYAAAAITFLAVVWSVPNYSAPVPSWYNLFFAGYGVAALFRYMDVNHRRWLLLAGICGGLSILVKSVGLYFVAGVLLFFLFREQSLSKAKQSESSSSSLLYSGAMVGGVALFSVSVLGLVLRNPDFGRGMIYFVFPVFALAGLLVHRELAGVRGGIKDRAATLLSMVVPFGIGVVMPIAVFLVPYIRSRAVHSLLVGVFILPLSRFAFETMAPPSPRVMSSVLSVVLLIFTAYRCRKPMQRVLLGMVAVAGLGAILYFSATSPSIYQFAWHSFGTAIPVIVLAGTIILGIPRFAQALAPVRQQQLMLLVAVTALMSLVQIPFAAPIYYCYVAPMAILAAAAVSTCMMERPPRFVLGTIVIFYFLFAVWLFTPGFIYRMGFSYHPDTQTQRLGLPRAGGLRIDPLEVQVYEELIPLVQSHAAGSFVYAGPDCPEIYFLSGLNNPTRMLFDFLDSNNETRTERVLSALQTHEVNVVAINTSPGFSAPMRPDLRTMLEQLYPQSAKVGRFQVRWRQ